MRKLFLSAGLLTLAACVETTEVAVKPVRLSPSQLSMLRAQIVYNFKDPESAKFRNIVTYRIANGDIATCGEVNGKSGFGAYAGYTPFYIRSSGKTVKRAYVDQDDGFGLARAACTQAAQGKISIATHELE